MITATLEQESHSHTLSPSSSGETPIRDASSSIFFPIPPRDSDPGPQIKDDDGAGDITMIGTDVPLTARVGCNATAAKNYQNMNKPIS